VTAPVTVAAPAKINLFLGVGPARADGYHPLATVYQAIGLYDEVTVAPAAATTLSVVGEGVEVSDVPTDATNLAWRAAVRLADHAGLDPAGTGVAVTIRKRIPVAGGMAGGSADAAAALLACDLLWGLRTPQVQLLDLAAGLGSDVPFCLVGGTALGSGRGEQVTPLEDAGAYWWVVVFPGGGLSTPAVYAEFDRRHVVSPATTPLVGERLLDALRRGDPSSVAEELGNDLQAPALSLRPELADVLRAGDAGAPLAAMVSGSGPTFLFLAADQAHAARVRAAVRAAGLSCLVARGPVPGAHVVPSPVVR